MISDFKITEKQVICGICPAGCWVTATYNNEGKLRKVRPDKSSNLGMICTLGEHSPEIVYSKDRLKHPMRRKGEKGDYDFERITWDDAYEIIVENLERIKAESGPEATAIYTGRGSFEQSLCDVFQPKGVAVSSASSVLFPFGSPNTLGVGALCYVSFAMIAPHVTMGGMLINMFSDIENAQLIVVWGANPATDCPPHDLHRILEAKKRGAEVVVIDPRRTATAKMTDAEWIPVRPGTDGALALGMCSVLIKEELFDEDFVDNWTIGFDDFARYVQHFSPEYVESITGVPANTVRSLARRIANMDGASPVMYSGLEYSDSGVQSIRATMVLWALAGQLDVPGGRCFSMRENLFPMNREGHIENPDMNNALGRDSFPVYSSYRGESHAIVLPESVLNGNPYKIRSLIILGGSMITSWPEPDVWRKTLGALDFLVTIDRQLTADAAFADIVLPATTMYEIDSYMVYGPIFRIREKVIEPIGEARNDYFILAELAKKLGYGHLYPQTEDELLRHALKGTEFSLEDVREAGGIVQIPTAMMEYKKWEKGLLRTDGKPGFDTFSTKFEIASTVLEENGYDALPVYTEPKEGPLSQPALAKKYPLVFNSGARVTTDFRSQHHGIPGLAKKRPDPTVTLNTEDAKERGIETGDWIRLSTKRGSVKMKAFVTDDIVRGSVDANMGGGGPIGSKTWQDCNINELTDLNKFDPISGFPVYKSLLCEVKKVSASHGKTQIDSGEIQESKVKIAAPAIIENSRRIYLDNNATTPLDPEVRGTMIKIMKDGQGNPSSIYEEGKKAKFEVESARRSVARLLNCTAKRLVFTGGGSEANNLAIKGIAFANLNGKKHLVTSSVEHPSVLNTYQQLESYGFRTTYLEVDKTGMVSPKDLKEVITDETCLVSVMTANNETGTIQPIKELVEIAHERNVTFHTDAVQAAGKIHLDVEELNVDLLTISGHKFYGPKGIGALYIRRGIRMESLIAGGSQENKMRAGTENVPAIGGLGKAADLAVRRLSQMERVRELRNDIEEGVRKIIPAAKLNGHPVARLPNTINMTLPKMRGESVVLALDQKGVALSSGSACRAGSPEPSHALLSMGLTDEEAHCALRFSLGLENTKDEVERTLTLLGEVVKESKTIVRFVPCR